MTLIDYWQGMAVLGVVAAVISPYFILQQIREDREKRRQGERDYKEWLRNRER